MNTVPHRSYTFLLRLWPANGGAAGWRAMLEDARSGERLGFASLEQLFSHLMQLAEAGSSGAKEATSGRNE